MQSRYIDRYIEELKFKLICSLDTQIDTQKNCLQACGSSPSIIVPRMTTYTYTLIYIHIHYHIYKHCSILSFKIHSYMQHRYKNCLQARGVSPLYPWYQTHTCTYHIYKNYSILLLKIQNYMKSRFIEDFSTSTRSLPVNHLYSRSMCAYNQR